MPGRGFPERRHRHSRRSGRRAAALIVDRMPIALTRLSLRSRTAGRARDPSPPDAAPAGSTRRHRQVALWRSRSRRRRVPGRRPAGSRGAGRRPPPAPSGTWWPVPPGRAPRSGTPSSMTSVSGGQSMVLAVAPLSTLKTGMTGTEHAVTRSAVDDPVHLNTGEAVARGRGIALGGARLDEDADEVCPVPNRPHDVRAAASSTQRGLFRTSIRPIQSAPASIAASAISPRADAAHLDDHVRAASRAAATMAAHVACGDTARIRASPTSTASAPSLTSRVTSSGLRTPDSATQTTPSGTA